MTTPYEGRGDAWAPAIGRGAVARPSSPSPGEGRRTRPGNFPAPLDGIGTRGEATGPRLDDGGSPLPPSTSPDSVSSQQPTATAGMTPPVPWMIWGHGMSGLHTMGVWTERVPGRGEDAEPLVAHHLVAQRG